MFAEFSGPGGVDLEGGDRVCVSVFRERSCMQVPCVIWVQCCACRGFSAGRPCLEALLCVCVSVLLQ